MPLALGSLLLYRDERRGFRRQVMTSSVRNRPEALAPEAGKPHGRDMEARIAVLEEIASSTRGMLKELREDVRSVRDKQEADFRITVALQATSILALAGLMAHGFHWF